MSSARACRSSAFERCVAAASFCCSAARLSRFGAGRALFRFGGAPVGFELTHLREIARFGRFAPTCVHLHFLASARRAHDCDDCDDDDEGDDDRDGCVHTYERAPSARGRNAGTAVGDLTALTFHLGYLGSAALFALLIMIPAIGYRWFDLNAILAFWSAYVLTRPLGASLADWLGKSPSAGGLGWGSGWVSVSLAGMIVVLVSYLAVTGADVQNVSA